MNPTSDFKAFSKTRNNMADKYKYKLGERVYFSMGQGTNIEGWAKVAGCSTEPMEGLGRGWIVELEEPRQIDPKIYPFSHIVIFDVMIKDGPTATTATPAPAPTT